MAHASANADYTGQPAGGDLHPESRLNGPRGGKFWTVISPYACSDFFGKSLRSRAARALLAENAKSTEKAGVWPMFIWEAIFFGEVVHFVTRSLRARA
jgi:hypothetical protein